MGDATMDFENEENRSVNAIQELHEDDMHTFAELREAFLRNAADVSRIHRNHQETIAKLTDNLKDTMERLEEAEIKVMNLERQLQVQMCDIHSESLMTRDWIDYGMRIFVARNMAPAMLTPMTYQNFHVRIPPPPNFPIYIGMVPEPQNDDGSVTPPINDENSPTGSPQGGSPDR